MGKASTRRRRRVLLAAALLLAGWLALSVFVVRPRFRALLESAFAGEARVSFALLWPNLDATAWSVTVTGERFRLSARRVTVGIRPWALLGGDLLSRVHVTGLEADLEEGERVGLTRRAAERGDVAAEGANLDPVRVPPLTFVDPELAFRDTGGVRRVVLSVGEAVAAQEGDTTFRLETGAGEVVAVPFDKLTARLVPRRGHVIVENLKVRAFNGLAGGFVDVDTNRAGATNGELEWHFVEIEEIWRTYGLPYAEKRRGDCSGRIVFEASRPAAAALKAKGTLRLARARFHSPVSFKVFLVLGLPALEDSWVTGAELEVSCEEELVYLERGVIRGGTYELGAQGLVSFDGRADLEVDYTGTTLAVRGPLEDPTVKVLPLNAVTLPFDRLFRERIERRQDR